MKEVTIHTAKIIANIILFVISMVFTVVLFVQFGSRLYEQILWGSLGVAMEFTKIYLFLVCKKHFKEKKRILMIGSFVIYFGLAVISAISSLGFAMNTISGQSFTAVIANTEKDSIIRDIKILDREIESKTKQMENLPADYITASKRLSEQVQESRVKKEELIVKLQGYEKKQIEVVTEDTFTMLGNFVDISGKQTLLFLLLVMTVLLEISLVITSGDIEIKLSLKENRAVIHAYIDALFDSDGKRLLTDRKISEKINMPIDECQRFKKILCTAVYKGKPMISTGRGGSKANYSKESIKKIIDFKFDTSN